MEGSGHGLLSDDVVKSVYSDEDERQKAQDGVSTEI
jgi:hypothetical protein